LLVHGFMNQALNAGMQGQPSNTSKTYRKPQQDFQVSRLPSCGVQGLNLRNKIDDGILVSEGTVVSWLQDEVLQLTIPPKGLRKGRRRGVKRHLRIGGLAASMRAIAQRSLC
jgi:hypothetical protein